MSLNFDLGNSFDVDVDISDACLITQINGNSSHSEGVLAAPLVTGGPLIATCYCDATMGVDVLTPRDCIVINLGRDSARHALAERNSFQLFKMPRSAMVRRYGARLVTAAAKAAPSQLVRLQSREDALFEVSVMTLNCGEDSRTLLIYSTADDVRETVVVKRSEETRPYFEFLEVLGELEKFDEAQNDYFATFHMVQREAYRCFEARGYGEFVLDGICREAAARKNFAVELASVREALLDVIPLVRQVSARMFRNAQQRFAAQLPLESTFMFAPILKSEADDLPASGRVRQAAPGSAQDLPFAIAMLDRLEDGHIESLYRDIGEDTARSPQQKAFHLAGLAYLFARQSPDRFRKLVDGLNQLVGTHLTAAFSIAAVRHR